MSSFIKHINDALALKGMLENTDAKPQYGPTFASVESTIEKLEEVRKSSKVVGKHSVKARDGYSNIVTASGDADKIKSFTSYGFDNDTMNWGLWLALYNDSWVFRRAIDKPAQDEVNSGFTLKGDVDFSAVYADFTQYKTDFIQLLQWSALFGGAIAVMMIDGFTDDDFANPIDTEKLKGKDIQLYVTDRWYGCAPYTETVTDMHSIDFGKPMYYDVSFADGNMVKVHHSWVLRCEHRSAPPLIKNGLLQGWGYAEGAHILNELARDDQLKGAITGMINKAQLEIVKMPGMNGLYLGTLDQQNQDQLKTRLEMINWARNYNTITILDTKDEYQQYQLQNISGLSDLLSQNMWLVAAALEMQGVLYGDLKGGLSQESDAMNRYAVTIMNRCNTYLRKPLQKFLRVLFYRNGIDASVPVVFEFKSLVQEQLDGVKLDTITKLNGVLHGLTADGVITAYQAAITMRDYVKSGTLDIVFSDDNLSALQLVEYTDWVTKYKALEKTSGAIAKGQFPDTGIVPEGFSDKFIPPEKTFEHSSAADITSAEINSDVDNLQMENELNIGNDVVNQG